MAHSDPSRGVAASRQADLLDRLTSVDGLLSLDAYAVVRALKPG